MSSYDFIVIGAGPAGLAFTHCASSVGKRVLLIERESVIGGCHRVRRVNGLFGEHGPRIYTGAYKNFMMLLDEMGTSFDREFTPYIFPSTVGGVNVSTLPYYEIIVFLLHFLVLIVYPNYGKNQSMRDFMVRYRFSPQTMSYIDAMCRFTDGAAADRYSLNKFLSIINEQSLYGIYQPRKPNDEGFLRKWEAYLQSTGNASIQKNTTVTGVREGVVTTSRGTFYAPKIIIALPPESLQKLLPTALAPDWVRNTAYINYLPITFHYPYKIPIPPSLAFPASDWGIAYVVLSDYMEFSDPRSKTVISSLATKLDVPSSITGKTANQSTMNELKEEIFRQLTESIPNLTSANSAPIPIVSSGIYRDSTNGTWKDVDVAFVETPHNGFIPFTLSGKGMYTLGTHNGHAEYSFTSLESAVSNAITLVRELVPETRSRYPVRGIVTLAGVIRMIILFIVIWRFARRREYSGRLKQIS